MQLRRCAVVLALLACGGPEREPAAPATLPALAPARLDPTALADLALALPPPTLRARAVAVGAAHACVLAMDDEVRCWGEPAALGGGSPEGPGIPVAVPGLHDVVAIDAGLTHTSALRRTGDVVSWGGGDLGEIGDGAPLRRLVPTPAALGGATAIVASGTSSCALVAGPELRCWGALPPTTGIAAAPILVPTRFDVQVVEPLDLDVDLTRRAVALGPDGVVWQWGAVPTLGLADAPVSPPTVVALGGAASHLATGDGFSCASLAAGVSCWGTSRFHFFGGSSETPNVPEAIEGLPGGALVAAGDRFACAAANGTTACAGWGELVDPLGGIWPLAHAGARIAALDGAEAIDAGPSTVCVVAGGYVRCAGWRSGITVAMPPS